MLNTPRSETDSHLDAPSSSTLSREHAKRDLFSSFRRKTLSGRTHQGRKPRANDLDFEEEIEENRRRQCMIGFFPVLLLLYICSSVVSQIAFKRATMEFRDYSFFLQQTSIAAYILLLIPLVLIRCSRGYINSEIRQFPKARLIFPAVFGFLGNFLMYLSSQQVPLSMQTLLQQAQIPVTVLLSFFVFRRRPNFFQYLGSCVILGGVLTNMLPEVLHSSSSKGNPFSELLFVLNVIPSSIAAISLEHALTHHSVDVFHVSLWLSIIQFLSGFLFLPLKILPKLGGNSWTDLYEYIEKGALCLISIQSREFDSCDRSYLYFILLVAVSFIHNILTPLTILYTPSSIYLYVSTAIVAVVTNVASTQNWIMGNDSQPFREYDIIALVVVCIGILLYALPNMWFIRRWMESSPRLCCWYSSVHGSKDLPEKQHDDPDKDEETPFLRSEAESSQRGERDKQETSIHAPTEYLPSDMDSNMTDETALLSDDEECTYNELSEEDTEELFVDTGISACAYFISHTMHSTQAWRRAHSHRKNQRERTEAMRSSSIHTGEEIRRRYLSRIHIEPDAPRVIRPVRTSIQQSSLDQNSSNLSQSKNNISSSKFRTGRSASQGVRPTSLESQQTGRQQHTETIRAIPPQHLEFLEDGMSEFADGFRPSSSYSSEDLAK